MGMRRMDRHGVAFEISGGVVSCPLQSVVRRQIYVAAVLFLKGFFKLFFWPKIAGEKPLCAKNLVVNNLIPHQHH
jgi:hypothetical protein